MCFDILYKFFRNIFYSKKNLTGYGKKCILVFMWSARYSCPILMKHEFSWQSFEKYSSIEFNENLSGGSRVVPCGQADGRTDGQDEAISRFLQFCERA